MITAISIKTSVALAGYIQKLTPAIKEIFAADEKRRCLETLLTIAIREACKGIIEAPSGPDARAFAGRALTHARDQGLGCGRFPGLQQVKKARRWIRRETADLETMDSTLVESVLSQCLYDKIDSTSRLCALKEDERTALCRKAGEKFFPVLKDCRRGRVGFSELHLSSMPDEATIRGIAGELDDAVTHVDDAVGRRRMAATAGPSGSVILAVSIVLLIEHDYVG